MFASIPADYNFSVNFMIMIPETSRRNTVNLEPYQMLDMYYLIYFSQPPEEVGILTITSMLRKKGQFWRNKRTYSGSHNY